METASSTETHDISIPFLNQEAGLSRRAMPKDPSPESSLALLKEGYNFIRNRCAALSSDVFETRLLLQKTICMTGEAAARMFYENEALVRKGGLPRAAQKTLTGKAAVMLTDGARHRDRKAMFMSLMTPERLDEMTMVFAEEWGNRIPEWQRKRKVLLFDEMEEVLCRAVCRWAGVPLQEQDVPWRTFELGILIDGAGGIGPRHWQARSARKSLEVWLESLVRDVRNGAVVPAPETALHVFSFHRDAQSGLLDARLAAVELINILRPTVAIAYFITFAAKALHEHPAARSRIREDDPEYLDCFVHEVRRTFAFFPFVGARVRQSFEWKGFHFPQGARVVLDLYGTCHDPRIWEQPETFNPDRFRRWQGSPMHIVPQGAGAYGSTHRCAGEWLAIEVLRVATLVLSRHLQYDVPRQDLSVNPRRMPMLPASHFVMKDIGLRC